jgi:uncharacterized membrane protein YphA (DoxX/SURF4 family)
MRNPSIPSSVSLGGLRNTVVTTARTAGFSGTGLAIIRILTGYLWYTQLSWKVPWTHAGATALHGYIVTESKYAGFAPYRGFISSLILPHFTVVAYLTYFTELALAISLILGVFARFGGLVGTVWAAQLYLGLAIAPGEWYWTYGMLVMLNAVTWIAATGRWWGVDQWLRPRLAHLKTSASPRLHILANWAERAT